MDSVETHQTRRPRQDPEDSSGSRSRSSRHPKKYRNRWLYGVLSCGGLILIILMVAIVALQVVYFSEDDGTGVPSPSNDSDIETPSTLLEWSSTGRPTAEATSLTSGHPATVPTSPAVSVPRSPSTARPSHQGRTGVVPPGFDGSAGSSVTDPRGFSGLPGSPGMHEGNSETTSPPVPVVILPAPVPPSTPQIIGMPSTRMYTALRPGPPASTTSSDLSKWIPETGLHQPTKDAPTSSEPSGGGADLTVSGSDTALDIRNILLWLILVLFGVGVILVVCTVLFVKGYCRTVCPQKGHKFVFCACCWRPQDSSDTNSRTEETGRDRIHEQIQMQHITRSHDRSRDDSRSGDHESINGTVRHSSESIETSFQAPPPYCVAMTLPSVPNTDRSQVIRTVNPPPAQVLLPSYEDAVAEGAALPS